MYTSLCLWLQQTLLRSAMRGAETEFSIKLVHRWRGIADLALRVPRVSMLRARDGDNLLIQYGMLLSNMEADFKLEDLVFNTNYSCSMY